MHSNLTLLRQSTDVPVEADVNGAAYALVKLQDTYNLTVDNLVEGDILGRKAVHVLSGRVLYLTILSGGLGYMSAINGSW